MLGSGEPDALSTITLPIDNVLYGVSCRGEGLMKKCVARLADKERKICKETIDRLKRSSQNARRARILLLVDADCQRACPERDVPELGPTGV